MRALRPFAPARVAADLDEMVFRALADFDDGHVGVFRSAAGGPSPWERHPDCDELLCVLTGEVEVEVLAAEGGDAERARVPAGAMLVVPRGCWHRQSMLEETVELYLTPGPTEHSNAPDPRRVRVESSAQGDPDT